MDTSRSQAMANEFLAKGRPFKRTVRIAKQTFGASPEVVFRQFCPTRERDWIDGWRADLVYTDTGYVEPDCIFKTPPDNIIGPGLWIFTRLEPDELLELVRIIGNDLVVHFRIDLEDNKDGTCTGIWTLKFTALSALGNDTVEAMPEHDPLFAEVIAGLGHFVKTGQLMRISGGAR